jgi:hypothetical protein
MKQHLIRMLGVAALALPLGAWAQQEPEKSSLDVTMEVVPFADKLDLSEDSIRVVPIGEDASAEGERNSRFGRATAFEAQQGGGADFGQAVSEAARANAGGPPFSVPKPPAAGGQ